MNKYSHLSSLVFNKPLMVTPEYAETIAVVLSERLGLDVEGLSIQSNAKDSREPSVTRKGIAVIPIVGSISHRATGIEAMSGMTSYINLQKQFDQAFNDPNITGILMDIDSPGGAVAGAFDFRDYLMSRKGEKPLYAIARDSMCSAAYLIGSTADKLYTTQTARVGSIGVIAMHTDVSEKAKKEGIKPTFITAGKFKAAGNSYEPLEGEALEYIQSSVDESYDMFVKAVAEARNLTEQQVKQTEAKVYSAKKAVSLGLADGVRSYEAVLKEMSNMTPTNKTGIKMENEQLNVSNAVVEGLTEQVTKLTADNETLRKQVLEAGFKITSEGLVKPEVKETMQIGDEVVEVASLPKAVVDALKEKAETELHLKATSEYPNLNPTVAKKLYQAFSGDAEMEQALKAFNDKMGTYLEELGDTAVPEQKSAQEKLDELVKEEAKTSGTSYITAYGKVCATEAGRNLVNQIYKEKE